MFCKQDILSKKEQKMRLDLNSAIKTRSLPKSVQKEEIKANAFNLVKTNKANLTGDQIQIELNKIKQPSLKKLFLDFVNISEKIFKVI